MSRPGPHLAVAARTLDSDVDDVVAAARIDAVSAVVRADDVVAVATGHAVGASATVDLVVARPAADDVVVEITAQRVVAAVTDDTVRADAAGDAVVAASTVDAVGAAAAVKRVAATEAEDPVLAVGAGDAVPAVGSDHGISWTSPEQTDLVAEATTRLVQRDHGAATGALEGTPDDDHLRRAANRAADDAEARLDVERRARRADLLVDAGDLLVRVAGELVGVDLALGDHDLRERRRAALTEQLDVRRALNHRARVTDLLVELDVNDHPERIEQLLQRAEQLVERDHVPAERDVGHRARSVELGHRAAGNTGAGHGRLRRTEPDHDRGRAERELELLDPRRRVDLLVDREAKLRIDRGLRARSRCREQGGRKPEDGRREAVRARFLVRALRAIGALVVRRRRIAVGNNRLDAVGAVQRRPDGARTTFPQRR